VKLLFTLMTPVPSTLPFLSSPKVTYLSWFVIIIESRDGHDIERSMVTQETQGFLDRFRPPGG
jgi:hypothetical protein